MAKTIIRATRAGKFRVYELDTLGKGKLRKVITLQASELLQWRLT